MFEWLRMKIDVMEAEDQIVVRIPRKLVIPAAARLSREKRDLAYLTFWASFDVSITIF